MPQKEVVSQPAGDAGSMLGQRQKRWPSIEPASPASWDCLAGQLMVNSCSVGWWVNESVHGDGFLNKPTPIFWLTSPRLDISPL